MRREKTVGVGTDQQQPAWSATLERLQSAAGWPRAVAVRSLTILVVSILVIAILCSRGSSRSSNMHGPWRATQNSPQLGIHTPAAAAAAACATNPTSVAILVVALTMIAFFVVAIPECAQQTGTE